MPTASAPPGSAVELQRLVAQLDKASPAPYPLASELLAYIAAQHIHAPKLVVQYGKQLILHHKGKLGDRVWDMYERVLIAALDTHDDQTINWCLETLLHKFGNKGLRMSRLLGLHCEYKGRYEEAAEHYNGILAADPTNIAAHKRTIALARATGNTPQAIALLARYTKLFASDEAGWAELSLLYAAQQAWELAAFCYEELLLLVPEHPLYHCRYAELLYAQGKVDLARQYFAQSVELKPHNNLRALYGILMCLRARPSSSHASLYAWTMDKLINHYTKYAPHMLPVVRQSLELSLTAGDSSPTPQLTSAASPKATPPTTTTAPSATKQTSTSATEASVATAATSTAAATSTVTAAAGAASVKLDTSGVVITEADGRPVVNSADENGVEVLSSVLSATGLRERGVGASASSKSSE